MSYVAEWTEAEIQRLKLLYPSEKLFDEVVEAFPARTSNAIRIKASRLGLRRPTPASDVRSRGILLISEGNGGHSNYLLRCSDCGSWIKVNGDDGKEESSIAVCDKCGSICFLSP